MSCHSSYKHCATSIKLQVDELRLTQTQLLASPAVCAKYHLTCSVCQLSDRCAFVSCLSGELEEKVVLVYGVQTLLCQNSCSPIQSSFALDVSIQQNTTHPSPVLGPSLC